MGAVIVMGLVLESLCHLEKGKLATGHNGKKNQ